MHDKSAITSVLADVNYFLFFKNTKHFQVHCVVQKLTIWTQKGSNDINTNTFVIFND